MDKAVSVELEYEGRPNGLVFVVGDRRLQSVRVRNNSERQCVVAKIQSTSSRKFRVRPGLALVSPKETLTVQIQLSPQEKEASSCKFLVVVRLVDPASEGGVISSGIVDSQQTDQDEKALWRRAEALHEMSLVLTETIPVKIAVCESPDDQTGIASAQPEVLPPPPTTLNDLTPVAPIDEPAELELSVATTEAKALVVQLLMKNQSRRPQNRLSERELRALRVLRATARDDCERLEGYARRLRQFARQLASRERIRRNLLDSMELPETAAASSDASAFGNHGC